MEYLDAKKDMLKNLSKKMFDMELGDYKGKKKKKKKEKENSPMVEVELEVKKTLPMEKEPKKENKKSGDDAFKKMVQDYFKGKKRPNKPAREVVIGSTIEQPVKTKRRRRKSNK